MAKQRALSVEQHVTFSKYLQPDIVEVTHYEVEQLKLMLDAMKMRNDALPTSAAMFLAKNIKKVDRLLGQLNLKKNAIQQEYLEIDKKGFFAFWDKHEKRTNAEGEEVPDNEQAINGIKAYQVTNQQGQRTFIDYFTQKPVLEGKAEQLVLFIKGGEEGEKEFYAKSEEHEKKKHELHVMRVDHDYLENCRVAIPTKYSTAQGAQPISMVTFFENLVIGGGANSEN